MRNNITHLKNCYGCGVCAIACSRDLIELKLNDSGFYEPYLVDENRCTNCGLCVMVCSFNDDKLAVMERSIISYAGWTDDSNIRLKCSSGGIGYEVAKFAINNGYRACLVKYDVDKQRAEHYVATNDKELTESIGSKYIQSYTLSGFKLIDKRGKYLVTGTPCQIDSFRRYIQKFNVEDNFILLDFFCHSVPSMTAWIKYLQLAERNVGRALSVSWRNKVSIPEGYKCNAMSDNQQDKSFVDWHNSYNIIIQGENSTLNSKSSQGDIFFKLFLGDFCCNPACQKNCKFKYKSSSSDIRIGDLWGKTYKNNNEGVSALITYTEKGHQVINQIKNITTVEHPFELVAEGQMKHNVKKANFSRLAIMLLNVKFSNIFLWRVLFLLERISKLPKSLKK